MTCCCCCCWSSGLRWIWNWMSLARMWWAGRPLEKNSEIWNDPGVGDFKSLTWKKSLLANILRVLYQQLSGTWVHVDEAMSVLMDIPKMYLWAYQLTYQWMIQMLAAVLGERELKWSDASKWLLFDHYINVFLRRFQVIPVEERIATLEDLGYSAMTGIEACVFFSSPSIV